MNELSWGRSGWPGADHFDLQCRSAVAIAHASCDDRIVTRRLVGVLLRCRQIFDGVGERGAVAPVDVNRSAGVLAGDADRDRGAHLSGRRRNCGRGDNAALLAGARAGCEQADEQGAHQRFSPVPSRQSSHDFILPGRAGPAAHKDVCEDRA